MSDTQNTQIVAATKLAEASQASTKALICYVIAACVGVYFLNQLGEYQKVANNPLVQAFKDSRLVSEQLGQAQLRLTLEFLVAAGALVFGFKASGDANRLRREVRELAAE